MNALLKIIISCYISGLGAMELSMSPNSKLITQEATLAKFLLRQACDTRDAGRLSEAVKLFEEYATKYTRGPVWAAAHARLGDFHREGKNIKKAESSYLKAWEHVGALEDARAWAAMQLGYMLILASKYKEAQPYFEFAQDKLDAAYVPNVLNGLGVAYFCDRKVELAYACWAKVIKSNNQKERARAYHNCAILCEDKGQYEAALKCLNRSKNLGHPYRDEEYQLRVSSLMSSIKSLASQ